VITTSQFLEILLVEQDVIETVITSMDLRKQLRPADSKLIADDMIVCFLELRAYRSRN
jgi:hypothetical protein